MKRAGIAATALAIPYLPFGLGVDPGEGLVGAVLVTAAALGAPGVVGAAAVGRGAPRRVTGALLAAAGLNVAAAVALRVLGIEPGPRSFGVALGLLVAGAGAFVIGRGRRPPDPRRHPLATALAVTAFALAWFAGTQVVPPLEDQDSEVQGTAYGLAHDLQPLCLTNRSTLYFFAHPLLLHAFNAATLTLSGDLETVRPPYDAARTARETQAPELRARGLAAAWSALRHSAPRPDRYLAWRGDVYGPFLKSPALFGTRAPNFALAALAAVLVFALARRSGAAPFDAALTTIAYATLPEIFVRSGYGGYYALTAATLLAGVGLAAGSAGGGKAGAAAGALAMLSNQKSLVVGAAAAGARALRALARRQPAELRMAGPLWLGLVAGGTVFWFYGLGLAPHEFVGDHLLEHGLLRFSGAEAVNRAGKLLYPTRPALWLEFASHMGWVWCAAAAIGMGTGIARGVRGLRREPAAPVAGRASADAGSLVRHLVLWVVVGAVLFTATDWRQTKHLCLLVPALAVLIGGGTAARPGGLRWVLRGGLAFAVVWNVVWIVRLAGDFEALKISTVW